MQSRTWRFAAVVAIAVVLMALVPTAVMAQAKPAAAPLPPTIGEWFAVSPGQHLVIPITYDRPAPSGAFDCEHECKDADESKDCKKNCAETVHINHLGVAPFTIKLWSGDFKNHGVTVNVLTAEQLKDFIRDGKHDGTGALTKGPDWEKAVGTWTGQFMGSGEYYLVVAGSRSAQAPADVKITMAGPGIGG